ncbi:hypothetical protein PFISCL1PPCAC_11645, partial [Pristionchus fissidentatus]
QDRYSWSQAVYVLLIFSIIFEIFTTIMAVVMLIKPPLRKFLPLGCLVIGVLNIIIFALAMGLWNRHSQSVSGGGFRLRRSTGSATVYYVYGSSYRNIATATFFNIINMIAAGLVFFL